MSLFVHDACTESIYFNMFMEFKKHVYIFIYTLSGATSAQLRKQTGKDLLLRFAWFSSFSNYKKCLSMFQKSNLLSDRNTHFVYTVAENGNRLSKQRQITSANQHRKQTVWLLP